MVAVRRIAALTLLLLVACGPGTSLGTNAVIGSPSPSPSPSPSASASPSAASVPADWTKITKNTESGRVTFAIPPSWRAIDLDADTITRSYQQLASANPEFGRAISLEQMKNFGAAGLYAYAFDFAPTSTSGGFATNMNAYTKAQKVAASVDVLAQSSAAQLDVQLKAKTTSTDKLRIGSADAVRNVYEYALTRPDGTSAALVGEQYYLVVNDFPHVLTFTTPKGSYETYRKVFEQIATSFRVG